jgi:hypothetical protein
VPGLDPTRKRPLITDYLLKALFAEHVGHLRGRRCT